MYFFRLTAFVVKSFYQARHYTDIDLENVARGLKWILSKQMENGQFSEPGRVIHTDMQVHFTTTCGALIKKIVLKNIKTSGDRTLGHII